ncbi:MAG: DUF1553 domain-containing protein, partial [Planctomycetia bacterium]|nr:DUF1553 domain-containing protein [Planctomycetia bacterium]
ERWARMWLDLARYADSAGYGSDPLRPHGWRYRDWVIDAFNRNQPFDQFTVEQIAGDLLPDPTIEQRMATAFHRNTMTNTEGGTDDEEFRVAAVKDRVDTTFLVWMGLTMGCAKCHNHKFDPITNAEYYQFYAFFNQSADADRGDDTPAMQCPTPQLLTELSRIDGQIAELKKQLDAPTAELAAAQQKWEETLRLSAQWEVLKVEEAKSTGGAELKSQDDGSLLVSGPSAAKDAYTISVRTPARNITAFRLEAIPDASLPAGGSGRAADGNFVLSRFSVTAADAEKSSTGVEGRFVRIELPGNGRMLSLAEVQVLSAGQNIAASGKASQSSVDFDGPPNLAIDGNTNGHYFESKSTTHTKAEKDPWWEIDLVGARPIESIVVWNRSDNNLQSRLAGYRVKILDAERKVVFETAPADYPNPSTQVAPSGNVAVQLAQASADFSQQGFAVAAAIDPKNGDQTGWAVAPKQKEAHAAVFIPASPVAGFASTRLVFRLAHNFKDPGYSLGRFRLSISTDPNVSRRTGIPGDVLAIVDTPPDQRTEEQRNRIAGHYRSIAPEQKPVRDRIAALEKSRPAIPTLPIMEELPEAQKRQTHVLVKGNFLNPGQAVEPGTPTSLHGWSPDWPKNRLGAAYWLIDRKNPTTARVMVNRLWAQLFGTGLVVTEEDFGVQGELPSHPELLDWLAVDFMESGWNVKRLLRTMVTSAAYRQSARVDAEKLAKDPLNRLLSRAARFRLEAETVRDQALSLAGMLSHKTYGPSVYPPQPPGLWQAAFNGERTWATSTGEDRYRRGLYTFWRRTVPYPSMATFDAPSREICSVRRVRTNTPLQAFVTLNDPVYVEAAQALARRIVREGGSTAEDRARFALRLCLARPPHESQVGALVELYASEVAHYRQNAEAAQKLATDPLGPLPSGLETSEAAAWTVVANVLLNLDAVLTKG